MLIAVPNCQGRVSPVFDVAARLLVVRLKGQTELERSDVVLFEKGPGDIARRLRELGVQVLICGGISQGLQVALEHAGVRVLGQICGGIEPVLAAYRTGQLPSPEFVMPGCCQKRRGERHGNWPCRRGKAAQRKPSGTHSQAQKPGLPKSASGQAGGSVSPNRYGSSLGQSMALGGSETNEMVMPNITIDRKELEVDADGFLQEPTRWTEEVAKSLAAAEGIEQLSEDHWRVIRLVREYHQQFNVAPPLLKLCKETGFPRKYLHQLFPGNLTKGVCKLAGLPKPMGLI